MLLLKSDEALRGRLDVLQQMITILRAVSKFYVHFLVY